MAIHTMQVTIGAGTNTAFSSAFSTLPAPLNTATTTRIPVKQVIVQNNAGAGMRVGDSTTTSTKGLALAASGAANSVITFGPFPQLSLGLEEFFVAGTQGQVLDVAFVK